MFGSVLATFVVTHIKQRYSPEQVAGRWVEQQEKLQKAQKLHGVPEHLSKDTVYTFVYEYYPELIKQYFRRRGKKYRNRIKEKADGKYQLQQRRMIDERDRRYPEINRRNKLGGRKLAGHWEGDTVI
jgi:IS30 family transposase